MVTKELDNISLISLGNRELTSKDCDNKDQCTEEELLKIQEGLYLYQYYFIMIENRFFSEAVLAYRSSPSEVLLGKGILEICNKFTGKHLCQSVISVKLHRNYTEIIFRCGYSPVNLLHISRTPFYKNTSGGLLLKREIPLKFTQVKRHAKKETKEKYVY